MAEQVVGLLGLPRTATREDVRARWQRTRDSARIATMLDGLDAMRGAHPEAGTFGPGASEEALAALARDLGVPLPEALCEVLRRVDGAAFDPDAVPADEEADPDGRAWCELLGVEAIRAAYADLIATHEAYAVVERWDGRWPVRARYQPREGPRGGAPVPWPFIPVCRTLEGQEVLVLHAAAPYGNGAVLDAFHEVGPRDWHPVYDTFAELFADFVAEAGRVRVLPLARRGGVHMPAARSPVGRKTRG